jgi:NADPH-dependent curcumin reductase CurA
MPRTGRELRPVSYPRGEVRQSDFEIAEVDVPDPGPGEVLVRNTWTSVDPALRIRLRERAPEGYFSPRSRSAAMDGILTIEEVVESNAGGSKPATRCGTRRGWRVTSHAVVEAGREELRGVGTLTRGSTAT